MWIMIWVVYDNIYIYFRVFFFLTRRELHEIKQAKSKQQSIHWHGSLYIEKNSKPECFLTLSKCKDLLCTYKMQWAAWFSFLLQKEKKIEEGTKDPNNSSTTSILKKKHVWTLGCT